MYKLKLADGYISSINLRRTEKAIKLVKDSFEKVFAAEFCLERISAPMFVASKSGINDDLNGVERAVKFDIKEIDGVNAEIVHSLAKWKRLALFNYGFGVGEGLYTDMNAIRRDDDIDNIHSIYVDQWDWEIVIDKAHRKIEFLQEMVRRIVSAIVDVQDIVKEQFGSLTTDLCREVTFITAQELLDLYPDLTAKQREHEIVSKYKTVFIMQIGDKLTNGSKHDGRAPDYDDWALNGDLMFWNSVLAEPIELSSMGIRVDSDSLKSQLNKADKLERLKFDYHKEIINNTLPLTIGGGIGQSRLCLLILQKLHIGEVQVSVWPTQMLEDCKKANIKIL